MVNAYYRPTRVDEALKLMKDESNKNSPLAGGTTLALNSRGIDGLVDLSALGFNYIQQDKKSLRIGATTPLREIQRSEPVRQFAGGIVAESAKNYLTALLRNRATLGGVLSAGNFWADIVTVLAALNASAKIRFFGDKTAAVSVEEFSQKGARKSLAGGILYEIEIPACETGCRCAYQRLAKVETDISILCAAAKVTLSNQKIQTARVVVGNGSRPVKLHGLEQRIRGQSPAGAATIVAQLAGEIPAESDIRASAEYRKETAGVLVRRLFQSIQ